MKGIIEMKQGALSFHVEDSIAPIQGFSKIVYKQGKYTYQKLLIFCVLVLLTSIAM